MSKLVRKIYLVGTIDEEMYSRFTQELALLEAQSKQPVEVELTSGGGNAYDALAFYDRIRRSPCSINITAIGLVASAAVLVLAAGDERRMTPSAWVMVHEDSVSASHKEVTQAEKYIAHMRRLENQWVELLQRVTGLDAKIWADMHKETTYMTPDDCVASGLVHKVTYVVS